MFAQSFQSGERTYYSTVIPFSILWDNYIRPVFTLKEYESVRDMLVADENNKTVGDIAISIHEYLSNSKSWSMGTLIFAVFSNLIFEPVLEEPDNDVTKLGRLYYPAGSQPWAPLDGYHRLRGMNKALSQVAGRQKTILSNEPISVLLLHVSSFAEYRDLLIHFRKSARNIDRRESIRTATNDIHAKFAEGLIIDKDHLTGKNERYVGVISEHLINWKSNTLTNRLRQFSTLSVLYDSTKILDQALGSISSESSTEDVDRHYEEIASIWKILLERFTPFTQAVNGPLENLPTLRNRDLCLKPTGQLIVISVIAKALEIQRDISLEEVIRRLNRLNWHMQEPRWKGVIVVDGRINGSVQAIKYTALFIAYLIGLPLSNVDFNALSQWYQKISGKEAEALPKSDFSLMEL